MSFAIHVCIKAAILLICAGLSSAALTRAPASIRHAIWAAALLGALALPVISTILRRKQMTRFTTAALLTAMAVLTAGLGSIQFTGLAAIPLPRVQPPIPAPPGLIAKAQSPPIAKPAQGPAQELGYVVNRAPISYPATRQKRVEGSVVVELNFNANGEIVDSRVLSGPEELRQSALQTALQGKYAINTARALCS